MRTFGANGSGNVTMTVEGSGASTCSGFPPTISALPMTAPARSSYAASNENNTSSDVKGWPSENDTFGRSFIV